MKEFKVKQQTKNETVYTLESASAGGTSAGAVASVSKPLGGVQRRTKDNILVSSKNPPKLNKPRNPVAHAHQNVSGGSGTHKDRSKTIPRKEKYKKKFDMAEAVDQPLSVDQLQQQVETFGQALNQAREITKSIKYDDTILEIVSKIQDLAKKFNIDQRDVSYSITQVQSAKESLVAAIYGLEVAFEDAYTSASNKLEELLSAEEDAAYNKRWTNESHNKSLTESTDHEAAMARSELYRNAKYGISMIKMIRPGQELEGWIESCLTKAASSLDKVYHYLDYQVHNGHSIDQSDDVDAEIFEDSDEADTALENLMSIVEYSTKLYKMIKEGDDLEGWIFMKITKASESISSAKHHLEYLHFKEHGMDEEFEKSIRKSMREGRELSKQEVIKWFVSHGKTAAQGAAAYERGWHGPKDKKSSISPALPAKKIPTKDWLPYKDDNENM